MNGVRYRRQYISSYPDGVIAIHLTTDTPTSLSFHIQLAKGDPTWDYSPYQTQTLRHPNYNAFADRVEAVSDDTVIMSAQCGGKGAVELFCAAKVIAGNGNVSALGNSIIVKNADNPAESF